MAETSHGEIWQDDGFPLRHPVRGMSQGADHLTLHDVVGRRAPVIGRLRRVDGELVYAPENLGSRRAEDRALLDQVASISGMTAAIPRPGRPSGWRRQKRDVERVAAARLLTLVATGAAVSMRRSCELVAAAEEQGADDDEHRRLHRRLQRVDALVDSSGAGCVMSALASRPPRLARRGVLSLPP